MAKAKEVIVSPEYIDGMIAKLSAENPQRLGEFVGKALVVLFKNQTEAERAANTTNVWNGMGFAGGDAYGGSLSAKSFLKYGGLKDWQIEKWTKKNAKGRSRLSKYHSQLNAAALAKKAAQENNVST